MSYVEDGNVRIASFSSHKHTNRRQGDQNNQGKLKTDNKYVLELNQTPE